MYHYRTRFVLQEPTISFIKSHKGLGDGYYKYKGKTQKGKNNVSFDYYLKIDGWALFPKNEYEINNYEWMIMHNIPEYLHENVLPITLIKRTVYDINNFLQTHLGYNLKPLVLPYFLFCLDMMLHLFKIPNKQSYFMTKIVEYGIISQKDLNKIITIPEYYQAIKNKIRSGRIFKKLINVEKPVGAILYQYLKNECFLPFKNDYLNCVHKHCMLYCNHCENLTFHFREWNPKIKVNNKEYPGNTCIKVQDPESYNSRYKTKLCKWEIIYAGALELPKIQLNEFIKKYQCSKCKSTSNQTLKLKSEDLNILTKTEGDNNYSIITNIHENDIENIKINLILFLQDKIKSQRDKINYLISKKHTPLRMLDFHIDNKIFKYLDTF